MIQATTEIKQGVSKRLINYAKPFQRKIIVALFLLIVGTAADLAGPLIAKVAIDNHILSIQKNWYFVKPGDASQATGNSFEKSVTLSLPAKEASTLVREDWIPKRTDLDQYQLAQILAQDKEYYVVSPPVSTEGKRSFSIDASNQSERQLYHIQVENKGKIDQTTGYLLTPEEVESLYIYDHIPLFGLLGGYAGLILLSAGLNYIQLLSLQTIAQRIIQRMRIDVFTHLQKLPISFFDKTPVGTMVSRITNDTEAVRELYVSVMASFVQNGVYVVGILLALFVLEPSLAWACIIFVPILLLLIKTYRHYSSKLFATIRSKLSELNGMLNEMIHNMSIVQAYRKEEEIQAEFAEINQAYFIGRKKENHYEALLLRPAVDLLEKIMLTLVIWYFGATSLTEVISFGVLYAFVDYVTRFFEPINMVMERMAHLQQASVSAGRVFEIMDTKATEESGKEQMERPKGEVVFDHVWFAYHDDQYILKDISFCAEPGQTIALVGHTGSGKSSLMNVLLKFYEYQKGSITIDGVDLQAIRSSSLRQHVGMVLQDPFLFTGDVSFNIRLYEDNINEEKVREAAKAVHADEFIAQLEKGYHEDVVERGATLSSGQRQLISFARALAADPAILVLDEATASIDSETESAIQDALKVLAQGRTTFIIAHRLSTIQEADVILVLSQGEIVEQGNHEALMDKQGIYYKMYQLQQGKPIK
ncbi:ABC transporter ATP-binding protein [Brevibacillus laterosporus]|uniref:ABC transporter ATP-binding protein n=1 Tax=Brevibacillus laterosporus TaxID=1465 RepID=UPI00036CA6FA|nr:ABC transporter ATP-binding protein [Brevibacillus laterosporus]ATO48926.1 multidrug ABC transporter permease [Brevibacillus laterosporus DSM 25]MED2001828.1 ABC transporter ATP-binding protein [Brevibacillus laterosporus]